VSLFPAELTASALVLLGELRGRALRLASAESCTGGLLAACLTSIAGSSDVFECGFVTYSNQSKIALLGVNPTTITSQGAVSRETAVEMAQGILSNSSADIGISITGIAGPAGGSDDKPVGLVHMAIAWKPAGITHYEFRFGSLARGVIQIEATRTAVNLLKAHLAGNAD
jgi:nicotinamide-nucleotide amidase